MHAKTQIVLANAKYKHHKYHQYFTIFTRTYMAQHNYQRLDQSINQHICAYNSIWHSTTLVKTRNTSRVVGSKMGTKTNVKCKQNIIHQN